MLEFKCCHIAEFMYIKSPQVYQELKSFFIQISKQISKQISHLEAAENYVD